MNGLVIGLIAGGVALVGGLVWAVIDNRYVYKRKQEVEGGDGTTPLARISNLDLNRACHRPSLE